MEPYADELDDFCRREFPRLAGSLALITGDDDLGRELAQEALARVCENWSRVQKMAAPGAWAHRVGVNLAKSLFARRAAERRLRDRLDATRLTVSPIEPAEQIAVRDAVSSLPLRQRTAVVLRYFADLSVADTSTAMNCAPGTVKALTSQALASLRARLPGNDRSTEDTHA